MMSGIEFVAVDFGAESGRLILATFDKGRIVLEEIHRFPNFTVRLLGHDHWNLLYLFDELKRGLSKLSASGQSNPVSIGVDTWGVDYGLLGADGRPLGLPYAYRDSRTCETMDLVFERMPADEIYAITGIQFLSLNTLFQIFSESIAKTTAFEHARHLLFLPDLFHYFLTGVIVSEYSIASTSQLLDARRRNWADEIFSILGLPAQIMASLVAPGTELGGLRREIREETGLGEVRVIAPASHDTASAVAAVPASGRDWAYLSSGTWSLLGIELAEPLINARSRDLNFTNEGGYGNTIRFLKNNMGLWLLERCRAAWRQEGEVYGYDELLELARHASAFQSIIDPDHPSFLNPPHMPAAIADFCRQTGQPAPEDPGQFTRCILESLALKYRFILDQIESLRERSIDRLYVVGGGAQNRLLNQFTADAAGIPVVAGPVEATAIGNILAQAISRGEISSLSEGREIVARSFDLQQYEPTATEAWTEAYLVHRKRFGG